MVTAFINPQIFTVAGVVAVVLTAATIMIVRRIRRPKTFTWKVEVLLGAAVLVAGALASNLTFTVQQSIMNTERLASIKQAYGIDMDLRNLQELRAPRGMPPEPENGVSTYGVTQVAHEGRVITLFLAWDGEQFLLYDGDGQLLPTVD